MINKKITKVKVDVTLEDLNAELLEFLFNFYEKDYKKPSELIEFIFKAGISYVHGQCVGKSIAEKMADIFGVIPVVVGSKTDNEVVIDKIFFNGQLTDFMTSKEGFKLLIRVASVPNKQQVKPHTLCVMLKNKPIKWRKGE
jgi:hypothetical protein